MAKLTPAEQAELQQLQGMRGGAPMTGASLTPDEQRELELLQSMDTPVAGSGPIDYAADAALRALDYAPGLTRTGVAALLGQTTKDDLLKALQGKAPMLQEYAKRLGVPPGPSVSDFASSVPKGAPLDITTRGAVTGLGDMLLSPGAMVSAARGLKNAALPAKTAAQLRTEIAAQAARTPTPIRDAAVGRLKDYAMGSPIGGALEKAGKGYYKSAFSMEDFKNMSEGARPLSEIALENNVWGTAKSLPGQFEKIHEKVGGKMQALENKAMSRGAMVRGAEFTGPVDKITKALSSKTAAKRSAARKVESDLNGLGELVTPEGKLPLDQVIEFKREQAQLADKLGEYGAIPRGTFEGPLRGDVAGKARTGIENAMDEMSPGLGGKYFLTNRDSGAIQNTRAELLKRAKPSSFNELIPRFRDIPLPAGMVAAGFDPMVAATTAATSKVLQTTPMKTGVGLGMYKLGRSGVVDPAIRESLLQYFGSGPRPDWGQVLDFYQSPGMDIEGNSK